MVAIHGRSVSSDKFIWGEIAEQLGRPDAFAKFWKNGPDAPSEKDWIALLGDAPTLILLDELPPYFDFAQTKPVGGGTLANVTTYALSNLLSAAMKLPKTAIVISNLVGSYQGASKGLAKAIADIADETKRQARSITPVDLNGNEIYDILRKRMFSKLPEKAEIEKIAEAYGDAISVAERSKAISRSSEQIGDEIMGSYPFHPSTKHIIALFKENENYRQTRGLMQFVSKMLKSVWQGQQTSDVYLIGCQHLDLSMGDVREEIVRIGKLEGALSKDVSSVDNSAHAQIVDQNKGNDAATQAAKLLLTASLSESVDAIKGLTKSTLIEYLISPDRVAAEFDDAFEELQKECWYLHKKDNDVWYFSNIENLRKRIQNRADTAPIGKIEEEMARRLKNVFEPKNKVAYQTAYALPKIDEVTMDSGRILLALSPDSRTPPEAAQKFLEIVTNKNAFCVVTGDGSSMGSLEEKTRRIWAVAKVKAETSGNAAHQVELQEEEENAEFEFSSALTTLFNRVYFPMIDATDKTKTILRHAPLKLAPEKKGSEVLIDGEAAVEAALTSSAALKLVIDVPGEMDRLISRAEDMLWPGSQTRVPWKDIVTRALTNARWLWLPPKGLEMVRDYAHSTGRWRYDIDGFVDKAPKPPKTQATVDTEAYDEATGQATLRIGTAYAGKSPVIRYSETPDVEKDGKPLDQNPLVTDATKLWFLVTDPEGKHEQGDAVVWSNKLSLTHQPQFVAGKRTVELSVVPRGVIRWNTDGTNAKEGQIYTGPIELEGTEEVAIYVHAEDQGVTADKTFRIPAQEGQKILDKTRQARLNKEIRGETTGETFKIIKTAASNKAVFENAAITVGAGNTNIQIRFGSEVDLTPEAAEALIGSARKALGDESSDVKLTVKKMVFETGFGLEQFATELGEDVAGSEIEQS